MNEHIVIDDAQLLHQHHQSNNNQNDRHHHQEKSPSSQNQQQRKEENTNGDDIPYDIPPTPTTLKQYQHRQQQQQQQQQEQEKRQQQQQAQKRKRQPYRHSTTSYNNYDTPPEYYHRGSNSRDYLSPSPAPIMTRTKRFVQDGTNLLYGGLNSVIGRKTGRRGDYYYGNDFNDGGGGGINGMGMAMIIIFLYQFRGIIVATLRQSIHRFTYLLERSSDEYGGIFLFFLDIYDHIRSYMYWGWDFLVRLRFILSSNTPANNNTAVPNNGRGRGRKIMRHLRPAAHNQRGGAGGGGMDRNSAMLPDLEDVPEFEEEGDSNDNEHDDSNMNHRQRQKSRWDDEIEPAFLRDEEYPKDWLVFHPCYGVIPKIRLDQLQKTGKSGNVAVSM